MELVFSLQRTGTEKTRCTTYTQQYTSLSWLTRGRWCSQKQLLPWYTTLETVTQCMYTVTARPDCHTMYVHCHCQTRLSHNVCTLSLPDQTVTQCMYTVTDRPDCHTMYVHCHCQTRLTQCMYTVTARPDCHTMYVHCHCQTRLSHNVCTLLLPDQTFTQCTLSLPDQTVTMYTVTATPDCHTMYVHCHCQTRLSHNVCTLLVMDKTIHCLWQCFKM